MSSGGALDATGSVNAGLFSWSFLRLNSDVSLFETDTHLRTANPFSFATTEYWIAEPGQQEKKFAQFQC